MDFYHAIAREDHATVDKIIDDFFLPYLDIRNRKAGYAVTMEPVDIEIMSKPSLPARIAFIIGPVGEEIELFCEK